jgi:flagellar biosynthesis protein FliP
VPRVPLRRPAHRAPSRNACGVSRRAAVTALTFAVLCALNGTSAVAQDVSIRLGDGSLTGQSLLLIALVTVLSLAPGLAVMVTCFPFIVTVLSILRQAIGLQQSPPNMLIVSLALFLTWFIMEPVFLEAWAAGIRPMIDGALDLGPAWTAGIAPFRLFMAARLDPDTFQALAALRPGAIATSAADAPLSVLVPSFMLSEIARAFQIGFLIFLPFLIIDLVVSAVLMSMGMMMVPPAVVALPFKLAFFVVADGWTLISGALVKSYF